MDPEEQAVADTHKTDATDFTAVVRHAAPFVAWLFLMKMLGDPAGWKYAVRAVTCLGLFVGLRPWRGYAPLSLRHLGVALGAGVGVFVLWIAMETPIAARFTTLQDLYLKWAVMPFGKLPEPMDTQPYAPAVCGWPLTIVRLLGSALVIAVIEEFFWRGFVYRWMLARDFMKVDLGTVHVGIFLAVGLVFGLEHNRWLAGFLAGAAFGWVMIRTRNIWAACVAHVTTNFLLGVYVIKTASWSFW